jgi:hypothetical protein
MTRTACNIDSLACDPGLELDCPNPNSRVSKTPASETRLITECGQAITFSIAKGDETGPSDEPRGGLQGDEWGAYRSLNVQQEWTTRSPKGHEPYGDGAPVVVRGRENRSHGEGGQVLTKATEACEGGA